MALMRFCSAWDLLNDRVPDSIATFCKRLDVILDGGVHIGQLIEIVGPAGSGKTQLCFQLAVDCQIPHVLGGLDGQTLYIDTEGTFQTNRLQSIAQALVDQCRSNATIDEHVCAASAMNKEKIFARIHYKKCDDVVELLRIASCLDDFVRNHNVKLIIIDSVTFPFRYAIEKDEKNIGKSTIRTSLDQVRDQQRLKFLLLRVAHKHNVAVVLTNHVTTRFDKFGRGYECAALSTNFGSDCAARLLLRTIQGVRWVRLIKTSCIRDGRIMAPFCINERGIRDVDKSAHGVTQNTEAVDEMANFDTLSQLASDDCCSDQDIFGACD